MSSENSTVNPYQNIFDDPAFQTLMETYVQDRVATVQASYQSEINQRDQAWQQRSTEYDIMAAEVEALTKQLADSQVALQTARSSQPIHDDVMTDARHKESPARPAKAARAKRVEHNMQDSEGAPSGPLPTRALRSSTRSKPSPPETTAEATFSPIVSPRTARTVGTMATTTRNKIVKPPRASELYRLTSDKVPPHAIGLKKSLLVHVRTLWGLFDPSDIPTDPSNKELRLFEERFSTAESIGRIPTGPSLVPLSLVRVGLAVPGVVLVSGRIAEQARKIEEHILEYMAACLSKFGLTRWAPDLRQTPYSLYNSACRIIALDTFKQAVISHAYDHLSPNVAFVRDTELLIRLYDHFVHFYLHRRYKKDGLNVGSVKAADNANPAYRGRARLAKARQTYLKENNYPQRYIDMIDAKATSDDEADSAGLKDRNRQIYWIKRRPERSSRAEGWIRQLDVVRERTVRLTPGKQWRERLRRVPEIPRNTDFTSIPLGVPIDYFDPGFFNELPPRLRSQASNGQIALLQDTMTSFGKNPDEKLTDADFMDKYGEAVLAQYDLDGLDEVEDQDVWLDDEEMESEDEDEYEGIELDDVSAVSSQRLSLVQQLSQDDL